MPDRPRPLAALMLAVAIGPGGPRNPRRMLEAAADLQRRGSGALAGKVEEAAEREAGRRIAGQRRRGGSVTDEP